MARLSPKLPLWYSIEVKPMAGVSLDYVLEAVTTMANAYKARVTAIFNDIPIIAEPGDGVVTVTLRYSEAYSKERNRLDHLPVR